MFFSDRVRSNIASRLRPWLLEEPDLELKLGFLSSNGCAKNLAFNPSFLNPLIESSTRLVFKCVKVGELRVRLLPWSTPSIIVDVLGLHVILAPRETSKPQYVSKDAAARKKKEAIASLDPEGASLHDAFERILARDIPADSLMISWTDIVSSCFQIKFQDIILELQVLEKSHAFLLEIDELSFESEYRHSTSLLRKFLLSLFVSRNGSGLSISCNTMKCGVKENDQIKWITSLLGLSAHVKLLGFQPMSTNLHVPSVEMKLSPRVIHLLPLILDLFSEEQGGIRTGKELWRTGTNKVCHLKLGARHSLQNAVGMVVLWLRYVYTYSTLLIVVSRRNALTGYVDRKFIIQGKNALVLISELEEKLPAQMVVQARRIARGKRFQVSTDSEKPMTFSSTFLRNILLPFWLLWKIIFLIFQAVLCFSLGKFLNLNCAIHGSRTLDNVQSSCFSFEEMLIMCSHSDLDHFCFTKEAKAGDKMKLPSFCLTLRQWCLIRQNDETKLSFFMALGEIKLSIATSLQVLLKHGLIINSNHSSKAVHPKGIDESKFVLWSEPTSLYSQVICNDDSLKPFGIFLKNDVRDLWSNWKKIRLQHEKILHYKEDPFLLGELKHFLKNPFVKDGTYGLWKYCLNAGKICLDLDYLSILSGGSMFRLLDYHSQCTTTAGSMPTISSTSSNTVDVSGMSMESAIELYANKCVGTILNMIPDKDIHVGAVIAGLDIRLSLKDGFTGYIEKDISPALANSSHWLKIDIGNTEFVMWPASNAVLAAMTAESYFEEALSEYLWLKEPQNFDAYQEDIVNDKFVSHGRIAFNACLRSNIVNVSSGFELTKHTHIVEPISIMIQASICRDYHHTFYGTTDFHSVALIVIASSAAVLFYMDVLKKLFQLFDGTFLEVDVAYNIFSSDDLRSPWRWMAHDVCSVATDYVTNLHNRVLLINATFDIGSVDIILGESRKDSNTRISKYADVSSDKVPYLSSSVNKEETLGLDLLNLPGFGLGLSIHNSCIKLSLEAGACDVLVDLSGLQAVLLDNQRVMVMSDDMCQMKDILSESLKQSYQFHLAHCRLKSGVKFRCGILGFSYPNNTMHSVNSTNFQSSCEIEDEISSNLDDSDLSFESGKLHATDTHDPASGCLFVVVAELGDIIMSEYHATSLFKRIYQPTKLKLLIFTGEGIHKIVCKLKGGCIFLEALALTKFLHCFQVFSLLISNFPSRMVHVSRELSISKVSGNNLASLNSASGNEQTMGSVKSTSSSDIQKTTRWSFIDALTIDVTQFSVTLAVAGCYGYVEELVIEVDLLIRLVGFVRKIVVDLHRLTVLTQHLHKTIINENKEMQMLHFCSKTLGSAAQTPFETDSPQDSDCISDVALSAISMQRPAIDNEVNNCSADSSYYRHSILNHMIGFATVEKVDLEGDNLTVEFNSNWVGKGSISGLDLMIKLSEIQIFVHLYALFSEIFPVDANSSVKQNLSSQSTRWSAHSDYEIPDGAVIAIQDLQQHMYFAVEPVETKYHLVGTLHYFLVGERALFKVRYHKRWWSRMPCLSFISLYAKDNKGEPLCMNFNPGSGFVGISGSDGNVSSLWQIFQHESSTIEEEDDVKTYATELKGFHVVNLKNDCAISFVDDIPVFVKRPGNQLKVKLFDCSLLAKGITGYLSTDNTCDEHHKHSSSSGGERSRFHTILPHVSIRIDKATLTIFHEVSDADEQLPLFRCCFDNIAFIGQILSTKLRFLSSFNAVLHQFDATTNLWREFITPVEFYLFYRSRFSQLDSIIRHHSIPVHFFLRMSQVDVSLTEVSLDALLFLIGKLDLAGPYAVRRSVIFPNSCKLENFTDLTVLCQFPKNQKVVLSKGQSSMVFLRFAALADQLPFSETFVSFALSDNGDFSTSPVAIPLSNACLFAWRTRIVSHKDSRVFPGPLVVAEVAANNEDGLLVVISPLLKLHNESKLPLELCFRRPEEAKTESASILLKDGDSVDDSRAMFDALDLYGGSKRTLMSLTLGNFLLSLRPQITDYIENKEHNISLCWSEELKGGKAVRVSGLFDKLNYRFRKALGVESSKSFVSTVCCPITKEEQHISDLHFLIRTIGRDVPLMQPGVEKEGSSSPVAMQLKKEIFIYPTVQVYNLLQSEIFVLLSENYPDNSFLEFSNIGRQATIPCQSSAYFYANPDNIYFRVTLNEYSSISKPVNSGAWVKKLEKKRNDVHFIDIQLDFAGGAFFATLRLLCSERGLLEATIFTTYSLQNNSELTLVCSASIQKFHSWVPPEAEMLFSDIPPQLGCLLPPNSIKSWFLKSNKVYVKCLEVKTSVALLDLDILTGLTELSLEVEDDVRINRVVKLGVSLQPCVHKVSVPTQVVSFVPRFILANESQESIVVRQCFVQDEFSEDIIVEAKQRLPLHLRNKASTGRENSLFDSVFRRHANRSENTQIFVQFRIKDAGCISQSWSGPICIASLGRFFLKFRGHSSNSSSSSNQLTQFAVAHIVEERSSFIVCLRIPSDIPLPYRIENLLRGTSIKYYQKDLAEAEILHSGSFAEYAWDDLSLPHKLIVEILDYHLIREINIDKITEWKPFFKARQHRGKLLHMSPNKQFESEQEPHGIEVFKLGFEVYADGSTRVLRLCESTRLQQIASQPSASFQLRLSSFALHFLEKNKQMEDVDSSDPLCYTTIIVARIGNVTFSSLITHHCKYNYLAIQKFTVDEKWQGAPFASMIRRSQLHDSGIFMNIFQLVFNLQTTNSKVKQVKYSSIIIQPIDLKIDEETLMKLVPFWRSSNSNSGESSRQFYFKQFEIHPVKIVASFLPGNQYPNYSSAQETLRSFLHSVLKVPSISNVVLELNGVLLTHTLVTSRELLIKCAQHYSWYLIRAVYIAKGSSLLPPSFSSIFDDTASSSLDVFFDPSDGSISLPGLTLGMFKIIRKCVNAKGFSGTRRYFGDLGKTMKTAGSNVIFAALTEISDSVLRGAETSGFQGLVTGFHQGILTLAMEPSLLGAAVMEGGPDRKIILDRSPGVDELYIEGYLQAMLDVMYKQEYLRVRVIDNQVLLKNLPPNSSVINEILESVKSFLVSKALLKGNPSASSHPFRHLRNENDWKFGPTVLTLCEHLFVSFVVRMLRKQANKFIAGIEWNWKQEGGIEECERDEDGKQLEKASSNDSSNSGSSSRTWAVSKFFLSGMIAYLDGRLCRHIPNPIARRIVSGFLLSFLDKNGNQ